MSEKNIVSPTHIPSPQRGGDSTGWQDPKKALSWCVWACRRGETMYFEIRRKSMNNICLFSAEQKLVLKNNNLVWLNITSPFFASITSLGSFKALLLQVFICVPQASHHVGGEGVRRSVAYFMRILKTSPNLRRILKHPVTH